MPEPKYRRLTRSRRGSQAFITAVNSRSSLWLGKDHVLCVDVEGFTETYKRFYFRDLQLITVRTTHRRAIWNAVLTIPLAILLVALIVDGAGVLSATSAVILAFVLTVNNILGPTCRVYFHTAVQTAEIPSLSRVSRTHKVIERIRPLIAAAQGLLSPEEAAARLTELRSVQGSRATNIYT
jgi:hypothetical protein